MKHHASASNFNGGPREHNLQYIVKHPVANTKLRAVNFTSQFTTDNCKATMINILCNKIKPVVANFADTPVETNENIFTSGSYTTTYNQSVSLNKLEKTDHTMKWYDWKRDKHLLSMKTNFSAVVSKHITAN